MHDISNLVGQGRPSEAFLRARSLAEAGGTEAQLFLGWMYHTGCGVERTAGEAERWYLKAAGSGSERAMFYLGSLYAQEGDLVRAVEWFKRSSTSGFPAAMYHLGRMYLVGQGVDMNQRTAMDCFEAAAKEGHMFARRNIAREMAMGRRGLVRIPLGIAQLVRLSWEMFRLGLKDPESDRLLRL